MADKTGSGDLVDVIDDAIDEAMSTLEKAAATMAAMPVTADKDAVITDDTPDGDLGGFNVKQLGAYAKQLGILNANNKRKVDLIDEIKAVRSGEAVAGAAPKAAPQPRTIEEMEALADDEIDGLRVKDELRAYAKHLGIAGAATLSGAKLRPLVVAARNGEYSPAASTQFQAKTGTLDDIADAESFDSYNLPTLKAYAKSLGIVGLKDRRRDDVIALIYARRAELAAAGAAEPDAAPEADATPEIDIAIPDDATVIAPAAETGDIDIDIRVPEADVADAATQPDADGDLSFSDIFGDIDVDVPTGDGADEAGILDKAIDDRKQQVSDAISDHAHDADEDLDAFEKELEDELDLIADQVATKVDAIADKVGGGLGSDASAADAVADDDVTFSWPEPSDEDGEPAEAEIEFDELFAETDVLVDAADGRIAGIEADIQDALHGGDDADNFVIMDDLDEPEGLFGGDALAMPAHRAILESMVPEMPGTADVPMGNDEVTGLPYDDDEAAVEAIFADVTVDDFAAGAATADFEAKLEDIKSMFAEDDEAIDEVIAVDGEAIEVNGGDVRMFAENDDIIIGSDADAPAYGGDGDVSLEGMTYAEMIEYVSDDETDVDAQYAYGSPEQEDYANDIIDIVDDNDPSDEVAAAYAASAWDVPQAEEPYGDASGYGEEPQGPSYGGYGDEDDYGDDEGRLPQRGNDEADRKRMRGAYTKTLVFLFIMLFIAVAALLWQLDQTGLINLPLPELPFGGNGTLGTA